MQLLEKSAILTEYCKLDNCDDEAYCIVMCNLFSVISDYFLMCSRAYFFTASTLFK
jgi:hypothetical protein